MHHHDNVNPRTLRERFTEWKDKRVSVGLNTNHYLCGTWLDLDAHEARFSIGGHTMLVKVHAIASISEAEPLQADFFK